MESVKSLFGGKSKDFITAVDEKSIIVVKELEDGENYPEMDQACTYYPGYSWNGRMTVRHIWHTVLSSMN